MRKLIFGLLGFAALGFGALSAQPAEAQPYHPGYHRHHHHRPPVVHRRPPVVRYAPPAVRRHYRPARVAQRCYVRPQRVWTGFAWVDRPVRICRY